MSRHAASGERLYVGNLPYDVTEREVDDLFYKFGRIREIDVKRSRKHDSSFAFICFDDKYSVDDAIERRDGMRYGDMCLRVERGGGRKGGRGGGDNSNFGPPRRSAFRVRVYGLPPTASWQDLKDHMRKAGDVGFANVQNRVGVVEYPTREEMEYAISRLDKSEFCNIFHKSRIRVERDFGGEGDDGYQRHGRRSRSRSYSRERARSLDRARSSDRARSPRNRSPRTGHECYYRRSRSRSRSSQASRYTERLSADHRPSGRSDKGSSGDAEVSETRTRPQAASRSRSRHSRGSAESYPTSHRRASPEADGASKRGSASPPPPGKRRTSRSTERE